MTATECEDEKMYNFLKEVREKKMSKSDATKLAVDTFGRDRLVIIKLQDGSTVIV